MTDNTKNEPESISHDQNFKNLILDYPVQSIQFFAEPEAERCASGARIVPIRQEQLKDRLGDRFRELDVPLLAEWPNGERAAILFVIEEETDPARFSIHRLAHYCLDLADLFDTRRVVPVVVFLRPGDFPTQLSLGGDRAEYLYFNFIACDLGRTPASAHLNSANIVARINLPNMAYPKDQRLEVYAKAREGVAKLETDTEKRIKYSEFIDVYAGLSDEETARYRETYLKNDPRKEALMGLTQILREEGWREGQQEGKREGRREGLLEGIELALSLKFGDESRNLAERIAQIQDIQRLKAVKEIIRSAADAEDFRRRLEQ
jgi:hypothetical protein